MKNSILSSIITTSLEQRVDEYLFSPTACELLAKKELDSAITLLSRMTKLEEVANNCLTMEGADKQANQLLFATLSGMDYTEEAATGVSAKAVAVIKSLIIKIKDAFQKYVAAAFRGNVAKIAKLKEWLAELKEIDPNVSGAYEIKYNASLLFGNDTINDVIKPSGALIPFEDYTYIADASFDWFNKMLSKAVTKLDYSIFREALAGEAIAENNIRYIFQKNDDIGFSLSKVFHQPTADVRVDMPRLLHGSYSGSGDVVSISGNMRCASLIAGISAWIEVIEKLEKEHYSDARAKKEYAKLEVEAAKNHTLNVSGGILQFISEHGRYNSDRIGLMQYNINSVMALVSSQYRAVKAAKHLVA